MQHQKKRKNENPNIKLLKVNKHEKFQIFHPPSFSPQPPLKKNLDLHLTNKSALGLTTDLSSVETFVLKFLFSSCESTYVII